MLLPLISARIPSLPLAPSVLANDVPMSTFKPMHDVAVEGVAAMCSWGKYENQTVDFVMSMSDNKVFLVMGIYVLIVLIARVYEQ